MTELGRIKKPSVERFVGKKKLYFVPLVSPMAQVDLKEKQGEFEKKVEDYWRQAKQQIENLEFKMGQVTNIYHEFVTKEGEEGLKEIENLNKGSFKVVKEMVEKGAKLCAIEDEEILKETLDWQRFIMMGIESKNAKRIAFEAYNKINKVRNEHIVNRIAETLQEGAAGVLFALENNQFQFLPDIEVFYIAPPALDEIHRYLSGGFKEEKQQDN